MRTINGMTLFWGHQDALSNFNSSPFDLNNVHFTCNEMCMMYGKAVLFGDMVTAALILREHNPKKLKALGRAVKGFVEKIWKENRRRIVAEGAYAKFSQNVVHKAVELVRYLLDNDLPFVWDESA